MERLFKVTCLTEDGETISVIMTQSTLFYLRSDIRILRQTPASQFQISVNDQLYVCAILFNNIYIYQEKDDTLVLYKMLPLHGELPVESQVAVNL